MPSATGSDGAAHVPGPPEEDPGRPAPLPRLRSWLGDWVVVGLWLGALTVAGVALRAVVDLPDGTGAAAPTARDLLALDALLALATVVPYLVYLASTETSRSRATLGKRWAGLVVAGATGGAAAAGAVWVRNAVKALPWQLGHLGALRGILEVQEGWAVVLSGLALVLALACAVPALLGGRGLHDRVAGTRVDRAGSPERAVSR